MVDDDTNRNTSWVEKTEVQSDHRLQSKKIRFIDNKEIKCTVLVCFFNPTTILLATNLLTHWLLIQCPVHVHRLISPEPVFFKYKQQFEGIYSEKRASEFLKEFLNMKCIPWKQSPARVSDVVSKNYSKD